MIIFLVVEIQIIITVERKLQLFRIYNVRLVTKNIKFNTKLGCRHTTHLSNIPKLPHVQEWPALFLKGITTLIDKTLIKGGEAFAKKNLIMNEWGMHPLNSGVENMALHVLEKHESRCAWSRWIERFIARRWDLKRYSNCEYNFQCTYCPCIFGTYEYVVSKSKKSKGKLQDLTFRLL